MYRGILLVAPQAKCTQFTFTEILSFGMEITTTHLELWKVSKLSANSRAKSALRAKLVVLLAVVNITLVSVTQLLLFPKMDC